MSDPELLDDANKGKLDLDPVSGEGVEKLGKEIMAQPQDVIERMKKFKGTSKAQANEQRRSQYRKTFTSPYRP